MEAKKLHLENSLNELEKGKSLIPGGVLGIRRPYNFVEGEFPVYFDHGKGGRVTDIDGNEYIDYLCAYGPMILGNREKEVDDAVIDQIQNKGFCFSLTQKYQNMLAEKMNELIPCAEMSLFVCTGSDATSTAIRLARSYTKRTKVMRCGYHGWHDWCVEVKGGVPEKLYEDVFEFRYNNLESLENLLKEHGNDTAAVIITPLGHPLAAPITEPKEGFLEGVKELCKQYGVVLIFDEIRTGFRASIGGAQKLYKVTPDLAVFGKAMANGYPIGAVTGKAEIMKEGESNVFISSTFFPNSLSYVAALKTIEILERDKVLDKIWEKGEEFNNKIDALLKKYPVGARISGIAPMMFITFDKNEDGSYKKKRNDFYTQLIRRGVFLQPYHHGYICHRHTQEDLDYTVKSIEEALQYLTEKY
ncbi:aminotransferase class III-fold pyridoxal phosphate-dependent enzyme [Carboxylicivirga sediminis]|uniref:Aminotransferase class III-fold pyridoxal phosphate-dependent enzyme n=1 Tax=Carboxylicivirga sediminis TaxID=2006564 RepID=A0A941IXM1_9BACT|nr:aminotransferase class III-fold pyridoxal phosphate-dependent enzyme [Carboxylicivirga sediminis]MBR8536941.1 aminotransferase class III-fold pyridoxal phosphate-dependent enzyme [Carboxylicivirga sediminis]